MSVEQIRRIGVAQAKAESYRPDPAKIVEGDPLQTVWNCFTDASGQFNAGIWEGEPGTSLVNYTEEEVCVLFEGEVRLTDEAGKTVTFTAGDCFAIPSGFKGRWTTVKRARKLYVIFEKVG